MNNISEHLLEPAEGHRNRAGASTIHEAPDSMSFASTTWGWAK